MHHFLRISNKSFNEICFHNQLVIKILCLNFNPSNLTSYLFTGVIIIGISCSHYSDKKEVLRSQLQLNQQTGIVLIQDNPFSGSAKSYFENDILSEVIEYKNGKKEGWHRKYFSEGILSYESQYQQGKKINTTRTWWSNGNLRSEYTYVSGVGHGLQKEWYKSGAKFKHIQLNQGREEGLQQSWRENGKIYNNYEAKNGRIYGLRRSKLCFSLEEEELK